MLIENRLVWKMVWESEYYSCFKCVKHGRHQANCLQSILHPSLLPSLSFPFLPFLSFGKQEHHEVLIPLPFYVEGTETLCKPLAQGIASGLDRDRDE